MRKLHLLSDSELLTKTHDCARKERRVVSELLWHLREVESRRLFAARGFSSLFEYTVKELGYSEGAAYRRVNAMRALKDVPQFEQALSEGRLSLSTLSSVQNHCRVEKVSVKEKASLVEQVLGKSQRETDRLLATLAPQSFKQEKTRPLDDELTELRIALSKDQMAVLEKARAKFSHRAKSWAELLEILASDAVKGPKPRQPVVATVEAKIAEKGAPTVAATASAKVSPAVATALSPTSAQKLRSRYIPRAIKRDHFARSGHRCEFIDPTTKRRCEATHFLELDHVKPLALGGTIARENLRVLCRAHNQWHALQSFGHEKMQRHWGQSKW
jgi:hypothetical protein